MLDDEDDHLAYKSFVHDLRMEQCIATYFKPGPGLGLLLHI